MQGGTGVPLYNWTINSYAPNGDVLAMTDAVMGTWTYSYDDFNRLSSGTAADDGGVDGGLTLGWTYDRGPRRQVFVAGVEDRYGNRWTQSANGTGNASAVQPNLAFYGNNNQVSGWDYDAAGNLTNDNRNTYAYDAEGRIVSLNSAPTYAYDAEGRRVAKLGSGGTVATSYILDLGGNQVTELNASGGWKHSNAWAGGRLLATYEGPAGTDTVGYHFHLTDWLGTQRMQTTAAGNQEEECYSYPFGDGLTCTGTDATEHHFTGKERDAESGLDYFGARYLSSDLGRFMTPDWAGKPTAVPYALFGDPQSLNLYAYVGNNPNTGIDLDGHLGGNNLESYPMESYSDGQPNYDDHPAANSGSVPATPAPPDTAQQQTPTITMTIQRDTETTHSTEGTFTVSSNVPGSGTVTGTTLEPPAHPDPDGNGTTRMPAGTYSATEKSGDKHPHPVLLLSVPGHTGVEVHPGNFPRDTHMCVLPGSTRGTDSVGNSVATVNRIRSYIDGVNASSGTTARIQVVVRDPTQ
jgi:RHS repeat-associated protein